MNAPKRLAVIFFALAFFVMFSRPIAWAQQPEYSKVRLKIFHLLNLVPGDGTQSPTNPQRPGSQTPPGSPPLATPTPSIRKTAITYKGNQVGEAEYEQVKGYRMTADIPEQINTGFDYYAFLKKTNPDASVRLNQTPLTSFRIAYVNTEDLTPYTELLITEEAVGTQPPTAPINIKYSAAQTQITLTPTPTSTAPTQNPTSRPQPTSGGSTNPTSGQPQPTGQGPSIAEQIQAVIAAVDETKIREYLIAISNKEGQTDESQTRFSGTPGNLEEQAYLIKFFQDLGYEVDINQTYSYSYHGQQISSKNIIARLYGQKRDSFYLMTAHMDSTAEIDRTTDPAPGVDDNGSGTVAVMEVARAFKTAQIQPQHSIEFILFSGEEQGLHGSTNYVSRLVAEKKIKAVINVDMIGNINPGGDCVNFYFKPGTGGNLISDTIAQVATDSNIPLQTRSEGWGLSRSDHGPFWSAGINTAIFGHECKSGADGGVYHSLRDKINAVSVPQIAKAAQAVGGALVKMSQEGIGQQVTNELNLAMVQRLASGVTYDPQYLLFPNFANSFDNRLAEINARQIAQQGRSGLLPDVQAADDAPIFAVIPFKDLSEIDTLFDNTTTPIEYLMGKDVPEPQFLGLFTREQIGGLEELGYTPRIVDENTDLRQYNFLHHAQPNQGEKLRAYGEVFEVSPNYFLLKLPPGETHSHEGVLAEFFELTLPQNISPPPYRTARITLAPTPPEEATQPSDSPKDSGNQSGSGTLFLIIGLVVLLALIGVAGFLFLKIRKSNVNEPENA